MDWGLIKKHPYAFGVGGVVLFVIIYLALRKGSSGSTATTSSNPALDTAANLQMAQLQAQVAIAQGAQQVADNQTQAQLQATTIQTAAQLQLGSLQTEAQLAEAITGDQTQLAIVQSNNETAVKEQEIHANAAVDLAGITAQIYKTQIQGQTQIKNAQVNLEQHIFDTLAAKGKLGGSSTGVSQIVSSVYGLGPQAIAANQPSAVASSPGSILQGVGSVVSALFG